MASSNDVTTIATCPPNIAQEIRDASTHLALMGLDLAYKRDDECTVMAESGAEETMSEVRNPHVGLGALLTPEESVLLLIDHQGFQISNLHSHDPAIIINNVAGLAKAAKAFGVPTILTTVNEERGGLLIEQIQEVFPEQKPINRTFINSWEDQRIVDAVKKTGRKKVIIAALWTEICLAMPAIQARGEGYDVFVVTDASGGVSIEAHDDMRPTRTADNRE